MGYGELFIVCGCVFLGYMGVINVALYSCLLFLVMA
jgi:hypothetical protein